MSGPLDAFRVWRSPKRDLEGAPHTTQPLASSRCASITPHTHSKTMADTPRITVGSAAATALQSSIQANLALRSWAEEDDAVMAEYGESPSSPPLFI